MSERGSLTVKLRVVYPGMQQLGPPKGSRQDIVLFLLMVVDGSARRSGGISLLVSLRALLPPCSDTKWYLNS